MQKLRIGFGIALAAALVVGLAAVAPAATNKLEGKIKGEPGTKVTARIVIEDRTPVRVDDFKVRKIDFRCSDGAVLQGTIEGPSEIRVDNDRTFESEGNGIEIEGKVKRKGRKISGKVEGELKYQGSRCEAEGRFKAN